MMKLLCIGVMENMDTTIIHWGPIGKVGKKMKTTGVCWGSIGITDNKLEISKVYGPSLSS